MILPSMASCWMDHRQRGGLAGLQHLPFRQPGGGKAAVERRPHPSLTPGDLLGNAYQFADGTAISGITYTYWIELVMLDGNQLSAPLTILVPYWLRLPIVSR